MTAITSEQKQAVAEAGDAPVALADLRTGDAYILMRADVYERMRLAIEEEEEDRREQEAWGKLARKARDEWAKENPY